ncbi:MAG: 16S rRNA (cytosine(1402)-N(4))-methyltransferase RsmH [Verrucomicrobia bacterium]|nr:16S rRNA (cytosine(1402)-N(4))-methyltransferase RsmH [Verrucomicrobiota bacterium]
MCASEEQFGTRFHVPVLLEEVIAYLRPADGKVILDGTVGGGGHSKAFLKAGASVIACDQDPEALAEARHALAPFKDRTRFLECNFKHAPRLLREAGIAAVDGVLLDLGVSSHQLESAKRGFSFQVSGPLDMRMSPRTELSAADIVNTVSEAELSKILFEYGDEPAARRVASHLVRARAKGAIETTEQLVRLIENVIPRRGPRNPATRVFQALRIAVNSELQALEQGLPELSGFIKVGARMAVITFHSLEDRIVKRYFRQVSQKWIDRPEWAEPRRNPLYGFRLVTARPVESSQEEIRSNARSRSAKLRTIERISNEP